VSPRASCAPHASFVLPYHVHYEPYLQYWQRASCFNFQTVRRMIVMVESAARQISDEVVFVECFSSEGNPYLKDRVMIGCHALRESLSSSRMQRRSHNWTGFDYTRRLYYTFQLQRQRLSLLHLLSLLRALTGLRWGCAFEDAMCHAFRASSFYPPGDALRYSHSWLHATTMR